MKFKKLSEMTFEEAAAELESIAKKLEEGQVGLDDSVALFTRGNELKQFCDEKLNSAKMHVEKIIADGETIRRTEPESSAIDQ